MTVQTGLLFACLALALALGVLILIEDRVDPAASAQTGIRSMPTAVGRVIPSPATFGANVKDYGARGDGTTDDSAAFQQALDEGASPLFIPAGNYVVSSSLRLSEVSGRVIRGAGPGSTTLIWRGNSWDPMWLFVDVSYTVLGDFLVRSSISEFLATAIRSENGIGHLVTPTQLMLQNIVVDGTQLGVGIGVQFARGPGGDNNNDNHHLQNVVINNYVDAAFSLEHSQVKNVLFENCAFAGNGKGQVGVSTALNANQGGSFIWLGGGGGGNLDADFRLGDANDNVLINRGNFEGSASLLVTSGPSSASFPVEVSNTRWESFATAVKQDPPGRIIDYQFAGPLVVRGSTFAVGDKESPSGLGKGWFRLNTGSSQDYVFHFSNNVLFLSLSGVSPFGHLVPTRCEGNLVVNDKTGTASRLACP